MDDVKFGLSDLDISDDLDVALDNDTYQDQANPAPPAYGDYLLRLLSSDGAKQRDSVTPSIIRGTGPRAGEPVMRTVNGTAYPVLQLGVVEIVEGLGDGVTRKVGLFQDLSTSPYERDGKNVSQFGDFARALGLPNYSNLGEAILLLQEAMAEGRTFGATLDWESPYDKAFVEAALEQLEIPADKSARSDEQRKLVNAIYRNSRVTGMRNFPFNAHTGRFSHVAQRGNVTITDPNTKQKVTIEVPHRVLGEARNVIEVRFWDMKFISRERVDAGRVTFGPKTVKPPAAIAA